MRRLTIKLLIGLIPRTRPASLREDNLSSVISFPRRKVQSSHPRRVDTTSTHVFLKALCTRYTNWPRQISYACPWAHRTLIVRNLKGLQDIIPFTSVHWHMQEKGWHFATKEDAAENAPGENVGPDPVEGHEKVRHLRDIYFLGDSEYKGRFTVPTLYDTKQHKIVSNESSEIIRMLYTEVCLWNRS